MGNVLSFRGSGIDHRGLPPGEARLRQLKLCEASLEILENGLLRAHGSVMVALAAMIAVTEQKIEKLKGAHK